MRRKQLKRDKAIIKRLRNMKPNEYQMDIAQEFGITPSMISYLKKKYIKKVGTLIIN